MNIIIECITDKTFSFSYEEVITNVIEEALAQYHCPYETEVSVTITDNEQIQQVNKEYRNIDKATDVLSFPMVEYDIPGDFSCVEDNMDVFDPETGYLLLGDIMLSYDKIMEQAALYGHSSMRELAFLVAHSMLHLFGYDHMTEEERMDMEDRQEKILQSKGYIRV